MKTFLMTIFIMLGSINFLNAEEKLALKEALFSEPFSVAKVTIDASVKQNNRIITPNDISIGLRAYSGKSYVPITDSLKSGESSKLYFSTRKSGYLIVVYPFVEQGKHRTLTPEKMKSTGWKFVCRAQKQSEFNRRHYAHDYQVFMRYSKSGEKYEFQSSKFHPPFLIIPEKENFNTIKQSLIWKITPAEYNLIRAHLSDSYNEGGGISHPYNPQFRFPSRIVGLDCGNYPSKGYAGTFVRELVRQSLSLSLRDELGLSTRDALLLEFENPIQEDAVNPQLNLMARIDPNLETDTLRTIVYKKKEENAHPFEVILQDSIRYNGFGTGKMKRDSFRYSGLSDYVHSIPIERIVVTAESMSRTKFKTLGLSLYKEQSNLELNKPFHNQGAIPKDVVDLFDQWNWLSQYIAIRKLHTLIKQQGESSQLLGALVCEYAKLGSLTEYFSTPASKVFKARSLLYAQRLRVKTEYSPFSQYHFAFALALAGLDIPAHNILSEIEFEPAASDSPAIWNQQPSWVTPLRFFCHYNEEKLEDLAETKKHSKFATYLLMLAYENSYYVQKKILAAGKMLAVQPNSFRAMRVMTDAFMFIVSRKTTERAQQLMRGSIQEQLLAVPGLPRKFSNIVNSDFEFFNSADSDQFSESETIKRMGRLIRQMESSKEFSHDRQEPSLKLLTAMLKEITFQHSWQAVIYNRRALSVSADDTIDTFEPLFRSHYLREMVYALRSDIDDRKKLKKDSGIRFRQELTTINQLTRFKQNNPVDLLNLVQFFIAEQLDPLARDLIKIGKHGHRDLSPETNLSKSTRRLRSISQLPHAVALELYYQWDSVEPDIDRVTKRYGNYPDVLSHLAARYQASGDLDKVLEYRIKLCEIAPEHKSFTALADLYRRKKDIKKWRETLDDCLVKTENLGLQHASIRNDIAKELMKQKKLEEALPYAEAAAQTGSAWGAETLAVCYTKMKRWDEAEELKKYITTRYDQPFTWFWWCQSTGHGDLKSATEHLSQKLEEHPKRYEQKCHRDYYIGYYFLTNQRDKAKKLYTEDMIRKRKKDPHVWLYYSTLADQNADSSSRATMLRNAIVDLKLVKTYTIPKNIALTTSGVNEAYQGLAVLIYRTLSRNAVDPKKFDLPKYDTLAQRAPEGTPTVMWYHMGMYLAQRGFKDKAILYLKWAATSPHATGNIYLASKLRELTNYRIIGPKRDKEIDDNILKQMELHVLEQKQKEKQFQQKNSPNKK